MFYGKICHEEGVVSEREFATEAEAKAFVLGFDCAKVVISDEDDLDLFDDYFACVDTEPAKEGE